VGCLLRVGNSFGELLEGTGRFGGQSRARSAAASGDLPRDVRNPGEAHARSVEVDSSLSAEPSPVAVAVLCAKRSVDRLLRSRFLMAIGGDSHGNYVPAEKAAKPADFHRDLRCTPRCALFLRGG
jgi:hypothetical protein